MNRTSRVNTLKDSLFAMRRLHLKSVIRIAAVLILMILIVPALYRYLQTDDGVLRFQSRESRHDEPNVLPIPLNPSDNDSPESVKGRPVVSIRPNLAAKLLTGKFGNYEPAGENRRRGPGEYGQPVFLSGVEQSEASRSIQEYGFNMLASDRMAMDRTIPDTRLPECRHWQYPPTDQLPTASVIVVFHNEGMSTLLRTIHSVINRSPPELLKEVIMVDDFSDKAHLKEELEKYIKEKLVKVKLFRNDKREGLIRTRSKGAEYAEGDVIIFLDAHCECNVNWLPPLLTRIAVDRSIMAVPIVDGIDWNNMRYSHQYRDIHFMGIFEWGFLYKEARVPDRELERRLHHSEPYHSPTHAGGLFAMDRKYFFELGAYDPGLLIWGGENFELSFKIWQCGGKIEWVPCSRVGHIYRNHMPYSIGVVSSKISPILLNYIRVVEVWMEEPFKTYFYTREPKIRGYPPGNITDQLALKDKYYCKSFRWYIDNVAYVIKEKFPYPPVNKVWGEIHVPGSNKCWDTHSQAPDGGLFGLSSCHHQGGNQLFRLNTEGRLETGERCLESRRDGIGMTYCPVAMSGPWRYDSKSKMMHNDESKKCAKSQGSKLTMVPCDSTDLNQQWEWREIQPWRGKI